MSSSPLADSRAPTIRPIPLSPPASFLWRRARRACCGDETPRSITRRGRACRRRRRAPRPISRRFCANSTRGFSPRPTTTRPSTATCARPRKPPARKSKIPTTKNYSRRGWPRLRAPIIRRAKSRADSLVFAEAIGARSFLSAASRKTTRRLRALFSISSKRAARLCLSPVRRARRANRFCANCGEKNSIPPAPSAPTPWSGCDWRFARAQSLVGAAEAAIAAIEEMPPDARVAAVALDRALARRFRARAAARGIVLRDAAGWRASTLVVGEAILRFAAAAFAVDARADFEAMIKNRRFFSPLDSDRQRAALRCLADGDVTAQTTSPRRGGFSSWKEKTRRAASERSPIFWIGFWPPPSAKQSAVGARATKPGGRLRGLPRLPPAARQAGGDDLAGDDFVSWLANFLERLFAPVDAAAAKPARAVFTSLARASFADFDAIVLLGADARFLPDLSAPPLSIWRGARSDCELAASAWRRLAPRSRARSDDMRASFLSRKRRATRAKR